VVVQSEKVFFAKNLELYGTLKIRENTKIDELPRVSNLGYMYLERAVGKNKKLESFQS